MASTVKTPFVKEIVEKMIMRYDFSGADIMQVIMLVNTAMIDWFKARTWDFFPGCTLAYLKVLARMFAALVLFEHHRHQRDGEPVLLEKVPDGDETKLADRKILKWQKFINDYGMNMENVRHFVHERYDNNCGMDFSYNSETAHQLRFWVQQMLHYILLETGRDAESLLRMYENQAWCDGSCQEPCP